MICHILLDLSIYGGFSQISLPDAIQYVLYGKRVVHFEKWTGGGKSTLTTVLSAYPYPGPAR